jgi:hypothetical protein
MPETFSDIIAVAKKLYLEGLKEEAFENTSMQRGRAK